MEMMISDCRTDELEKGEDGEVEKETRIETRENTDDGNTEGQSEESGRGEAR